ncbi:hypothetical protein A2U01_0004677, partial [Trifolium medium]|nr:hypothetical protein [Trifolium medium]
VLNMAEPAEDHCLVDTITDPELAWVGPEPRGIASVITPTTLGVYTIVEEDWEVQQNWEVHLPNLDHRICSKFPDDGFGMYEFVFKDLKLRLPFSGLPIGVLGWLNLAPSQLHPNSLAFIRAFELVCEYLEVEPTVPLFFPRFQAATSADQGWTAWLVRPLTHLVVDNLFESEFDTEEDGTVRRDEEGNEMTRLVSRFPLCWSRKHFEKSTDYYLTKEETMTSEDLAGLEKLKPYVKSFKLARWETKARVPVLDANGNERFEKRFINTKDLLVCESVAEAKLCLDNMATFTERIIKLAADQKGSKKGKKSQGRSAIVIGESRSGPGSSSSPGGGHVSSTTPEEPPQKRLREEEPAVNLWTRTGSSCSPPALHWNLIPYYSSERARRRALSPRLEPPIASWVLSPGTATMELVSRVVLIEQRLCSYFDWRLAFFLMGVPRSRKLFSLEVLEVVRSIVCFVSDAIRSLPVSGKLALVGVFGVSP